MTLHLRWLVAAAVLTGGVFLAGCGPQELPLDESLTVEDAKAQTQAFERRLVEGVPAASVATVEQSEWGNLMSCPSRGENAYYWSGTTWVHLAEPIDESTASALAEEVAENLGELTDQGYQVAVSNSTEWPAVKISTDANAFYVMSLVPGSDDGNDLAQIRIVSASDCFRLPEDVYPGGNF